MDDLPQAQALVRFSEREERKAERVYRGGRKREQAIVDLATHQRLCVCLRVAAEYLELDERTVRARIEDGRLSAIKDGRVYRIPVASLRAYEEMRRAS